MLVNHLLFSLNGFIAGFYTFDLVISFKTNNDWDVSIIVKLVLACMIAVMLHITSKKRT